MEEPARESDDMVHDSIREMRGRERKRERESALRRSKVRHRIQKAFFKTRNDLSCFSLLNLKPTPAFFPSFQMMRENTQQQQQK